MKVRELKALLNLYSDDACVALTDPGSLFVRDLKNDIKYKELLEFGKSEDELYE